MVAIQPRAPQDRLLLPRPAAAAQDLLRARRAAPARRPPSAHAQPAGVARVLADLVGRDLLRIAVVGLLRVGVAGVEPIAPRVRALIGAARRALPLELGAEPRAGEAARGAEPRDVRLRVVPA